MAISPNPATFGQSVLRTQGAKENLQTGLIIETEAGLQSC